MSTATHNLFRWSRRTLLASAIAASVLIEGAAGLADESTVDVGEELFTCGGSEAELTEAVTVTVSGYSQATWDNVSEALFENGVAAMLVGGQVDGGRLRPKAKILYTRESGNSNVLVAFCVALFPSEDLIDGHQLTMDLSESSRLGYFSGASGGMTFSDVTNGVTADCTVTGDTAEVLKEIDWMVVGAIIAVTGLVLFGGAIVCLVAGCGKKKEAPTIIISGGPMDVTTARTRYVREVMQPGPGMKGQASVDLGMGLNANTTLHTHL